MVASRLGYAANALAQGQSGVMVGWRPDEPGSIPFEDDPRIQMYTLDDVLDRTEHLLDGSHPTTIARVQLLAKAQGILTL